MLGKRYSITLIFRDNATGIENVKVFTAKRATGAWKQTFEDMIKHFTPNQVVTFLCKKYELGYGYSTLLGILTLGKWDDKINRESDDNESEVGFRKELR